MKQVQMPLKARVTGAFTLLGLLVVVATVLILAALLLSQLARAKASNPDGNCVGNLKQVGLSFRIWSGDNRDRYPMQVPTNEGGTMEFLAGTNVSAHFRALSNELNTPKVLACPTDSRSPATNFTSDLNDSKVSYFIGLDADETNTNMFLAGDRNLTSKTPPPNGMLNLTGNPQLSWTKQMHQNKGHILLADGSVLSLKNRQLHGALANAGTNGNRLLFP